MSSIIPFTFPETGQPVRSLMIGGEPWFHHGDVCTILQHTNPSVAARMLDDDESDMLDLRELSAGQTALNSFRAPATGNAQARFVTEPGLYTLVFNSKAPGAPAFRRWVTHEVLPAIRQTGRYEAPVAEPVRIGAATVTWDHAAAVARLHHGLSVDAHGFKELLVTGGILTTRNGIPHRKWEHLFWPSPAGSRWEIHASVLPQLIHFAAKIRRDLALAERDLQMSLPFPIAAIVRDELQGGAA